MKTDDHILGRPDARVTLVEYGDYECPFCAHAYLVRQVVLAELEHSVRFVFRNFPLMKLRRNSFLAAQAAESVGGRAGERAFWKMHGMLCENYDALEIDDLLGYAEAVGAPVDDVASDLATGAMRARVERDIELGTREGVRVTPTFFVNGQRFAGDWADADAFTAALEEAARERALH